MVAKKIKKSLSLMIYQFFICFLTYHALNQVKNVDQTLSFFQRFSELMRKTFSTQGVFNFSSSSKLLFALAATISFGLFVFKLIFSDNNYYKRENFQNKPLNLLSTKMIKALFVAFVPFLIPVLAGLYNQNSIALIICSSLIGLWYMLSQAINDKNTYFYYYGYSSINKTLNNKPISYYLETKDDKTTKLFNLLKLFLQQ